MIRGMRFFGFALLIPLLLLWNPTPSAAPSDYAGIKQRAEALFAEGSYAHAHQIYQEAEKHGPPESERPWVAFRLADTLWRSQAATNNPDPTQTEQARTALEHMIRDVTRAEDRGRVWAEVQESLGDFWWLGRPQRNWGAAWQHYQPALDWWAGARDIEQARGRYLGIVWNISAPPWRDRYYHYGNYGNRLPLEILENVLKIAQKKEDRHHAQYLIALTLRHQGGWDAARRAQEAFEAAIDAGKESDWYDDALFEYAQWLAQQGEVIILKNGQPQRRPNFVKALEVYRRLVNEFSKGETRYYENAKRQIEQITQPMLGVAVSNIFLPESEIQFTASWRNLTGVDFSVYSVDLTRDVDLTPGKSTHEWLEHVQTIRGQRIKHWSAETNDEGEHRPGSREIRLEGKLAPGAYLLEAAGGGKTARELLLVSDAALVLKTSGSQALVFFADSLDGHPLPQASVRLWERYYDGRAWHWRKQDAVTDADGLALFEILTGRNNQLFAAARGGERQALALGAGGYHPGEAQQWKLYVHTDRPAYRPLDTAHWKVTARTYDGSVHHTPAGQNVPFEITDPRGSRLKEGTLKLNDFGSGWDALTLSETLPLGEYRINFWTEDKKKHIGSAVLFRLEEYKLPEFKVKVETPEEDGKKKLFLAGDAVEVNIAAEYYFGGPVANASVEVLVYQKPFYPSWRPEPEYPWYYEDMDPRPRYWGRGQQIKREVLKTDAQGRARLTFDSQRGQNLEYRIEARVTDASRREVVSSGAVRVAQQKFFAYLHPKHQLYRPNDAVTVTLKTLDANQQPVAARGTVAVTRDFWFEIWTDPDGREIQGPELEQLKKDPAIWPPVPVPPGRRGWRLKFRGYRHDEILTRSVQTSTEGEAEITFTPSQEGYYRFAFSHEDGDSPPIQAETTVWVATTATSELGYRHGALQLIVDKDTFHAGQPAAVMISVPASGRWVLFSVEGDTLHQYRMVHVTGTVKLVTLDIEEQHVPNIFLNGIMISDRQIHQDTRQVIVPPVKQFLTVEVKPDRPQYEPREEGTLTLTTRDHAGRPVAAEVALALADESVFYIQKELAPDPRRFFYGQKRSHRVRTSSTFQMKRYARLEEVDGQLREASSLEDLKREGERSDRDAFGDEGRFNQYKSRAPMSKAARAVGGAVAQEAMSELAADAAAPMEERKISSLPGGKGGGGDGEESVQVRSDFRATVFWQPDIHTGPDGTATVRVRYPDSLTQWRATARAVTQDNRFGQARAETRTQKPLIARLQAPRFFVTGDEVTLSANLNNNTDQPIQVTPSLQAAGLEIIGPIKGESGPVTVPARGEARVDWRARVPAPGAVKLKITARGEKHSDAMEKTLIAHEHGIEKLIARSGKMRGEAVTLNLDLPPERKPGTTRLTVQVTPSLAVSMLDALPYLIDYPYGCTEQTLSRFLPTVLVAKTLRDLGLKEDDVLGRVFGGIDAGKTEKTHRGGKRNLRELDRMVDAGLNRLYDFQHGDGGWAWWKQGDSDPFMSAYVLWGLTLARQAGVKVDPNVLERAYQYLVRVLVEAETQYDLQTWELHAVSAYLAANKRRGPGKFETQAFDNLWTHRDGLNAYTRALLALSAQALGDAKRREVLVRNLENGVIEDTAPDTSSVQRGRQSSHGAVMGTAHWGEDGIFYRWSQGGVEATAFGLMALLAQDPQHRLVEPVVNWLVKNRRGAHWSNTRDTALVLLAMTGYLQHSGELKGGLAYQVSFNGERIAQTKVTDVLAAPAAYEIDPASIRDGNNAIEIIRTQGDGPLYFAAYAEFFSREEPVTPAGNELFVRRQYYKLVGRPTLLKGYVYDKQPLDDGGTVQSGDRIETVLTIEAKNHYEYLVFEDLKPAGFEAVQVQSGEPLPARELKRGAVERRLSESKSAKDKRRAAAAKPGRTAASSIGIVQPEPGGTDYTGRRRGVYQELRDRKVALFIDKLPEGVWEIRYTLRAEAPGRFHALPLMGHAMYIPEIRTNGAEVRVTVRDSKE